MALNLSQLDGTNGFRLDGIEARDYSGISVAGAGDVNGDGIDDLIIGAPSYNGAGESYVVFGSTTGFGATLDLASLDGANGFRLDGIDAGDRSGSSVAGAGDVNGDGIEDFIIGAPGAEGFAGECYVVFGSAAGFDASFDLSTLDGANGFRLDGIDASDRSGSSVAGAGDLNGDGIEDLIVGALGANRGAGESYVVFGSSASFGASLDMAGLNGDNGFRLSGIDDGDLSGESVAGAGDVNGDGIDDLIIGASEAVIGGESYVVFGSAAGFSASVNLAALDGANGFRLDGTTNSGNSVAAAGDVNGDGIDDLIIGEDRADADDGRYDAGASYVVFGTAAGFSASLDLFSLDGNNGFRLVGVDRYDRSGFSVAGAGDVNGDGFEDLIIAVPGGDTDGASFVVFGTAAGFEASLDLAALDGTTGFRVDGSGFSVAGAGDVNGDGIDDLAVGTPFAGVGGESYVVFGSADLGGANDAPSAADDALSVATSDIVDLADDNGAGSDRDPDLDDLSITAIDGAPVTEGDSVTLASGLRVTVLAAAEVRFDAPGVPIGRSLSDSFAYEISDGRGGSDTATGSVDYVQNAVDLLALDGSTGFSVDGPAGSNTNEVSVAGAGDVNGDGIDDLIIGAHRAHPDGRYFAGESYVVFGSSAAFPGSLNPSSLDGTNGFRLDGIEAADESGYSVAGAGDVNGDGIDDLIIGAHRADTGGRNGAGESYVVFGSAVGFGASFDLSALDGANGFRIDGVAEYDFSGGSVAGAGDVNGDGIDDLIIGAESGDPGGASYVVFGSAAGFRSSLDLATLDGANGFRLNGIDVYNQLGVSVAGAGDVNGDGVDDLIIAATGDERGGISYAGASYVVFGSKADFAASLDLAALDGTNGFRLDGIDASDFEGVEVAGAGDVNGDGIDDLIIGAPGADPGGECYVVFGSISGFGASLDLAALDGANGFRLDGIDGSGLLSVAGAGDVNGDGIDDLIVGAPFAEPGGRSYVVFGTAAGFAANLDLAGLDGANGFRLDGAIASGGSVAGAGDVNDDGIDDLVIGDGRAGDSYVVFGFRTGPTPPIVGGPGPDVLTGTPAADRIFGLGGDDRLTGLAGNDLLRGGTGRDILEGGDGDDWLGGGRGKDQLLGGSGEDTLVARRGNDTLVGDTGADVFVFDDAFGCDRICDFDANPGGGQDRIDLRPLGVSLASFAEDVTVRDLGVDTRVSVEGHGAILCKGVTGDGANVIDVADFLLSG